MDRKERLQPGPGVGERRKAEGKEAGKGARLVGTEAQRSESQYSDPPQDGVFRRKRSGTHAQTLSLFG